jgi:hypothetical protein
MGVQSKLRRRSLSRTNAKPDGNLIARIAHRWTTGRAHNVSRADRGSPDFLSAGTSGEGLVVHEGGLFGIKFAVCAAGERDERRIFL